MSTVRAQLAAALAKHLPADWHVYMVGGEPTTATKPAVVIYRTAFRRLPQAPSAQYEHDFDVWALVAPDASDATLDDRAETLYGALEDVPFVTPLDATREAYQGQWPGFRIAVQVNTKKEQPA
ncbi:hypothetical protein CWIS_09720 [Cellulomonas sp. A375-1]|uniref:hypothetical protein n=1 Tax=Cellulomonas sp. A375-1 TaxID=1672219 RepID=UPI0006527752|nr:hypothetical protein [Cellulomonas sp. A375-1]KMM45608.1 hypothetical protein CWIS_09720 [Cellulomonas sp. A375-1]